MEDRRFWEHNGIDLRSIMRAAAGILTGDYAGGGSTITQQLVKNNVLAGGSETSWGARLERKLQEQYLAVKLEQSSQMSKEETKKWILTNYLNSINLGNNTLGVKTAARRYFDKELAAITSNPSRYNPISHPEQNQARRQIVLQYMEDLGYISGEEREAALSEEVYEEIRTVNQRVGENTPYSYFTDELIRQVQRELVERLGYTDSEAYSLLYSGGLRIYSTQDPEIQGIVDEEISDPGSRTEAWSIILRRIWSGSRKTDCSPPKRRWKLLSWPSGTRFFPKEEKWRRRVWRRFWSHRPRWC